MAPIDVRQADGCLWNCMRHVMVRDARSVMYRHGFVCPAYCPRVASVDGGGALSLRQWSPYQSVVLIWAKGTHIP